MRWQIPCEYSVSYEVLSLGPRAVLHRGPSISGTTLFESEHLQSASSRHGQQKYHADLVLQVHSTIGVREQDLFSAVSRWLNQHVLPSECFNA